MSFDSLNLTTKQYQKSMKYLGEAKINMSLRRIERAIDYLNKDLKFRESIQTRKRHRVHKGAAYYNLGLCHLFEEKRDMNKVVLNFLLAYIEDGLSSHPVVGHAESGEAARMLRVNLKINPGYLMTIGVLIEDTVDDPKNVLDPSDLLPPPASAGLPSVGMDRISELCQSTDVLIPRKTPIPNILDRRRRVFIGGNYTSQTSNLLKIKETVLRLGFDPVITDDYGAPEDKARELSLMLLHTCKSAIFDITVAGGQYIEIERAKDYGIEPLLIFSADTTTRDYPLTSGTKMLGIRPKAYRDLETDLEPLIRDHLKKTI